MHITAQVGKDDSTMGSQFKHDLAADSTWTNRLDRIGDDSKRNNLALTGSKGVEQCNPIGTNRSRICGVFDVTSRKDPPACGEGCRANRETRIRRVGACPSLQRSCDECLMIRCG